MRFNEREALATVERLTVTRLRTWTESDCVRPERGAGAPAFTEVDVARLRLLCSLQDDLNLNDDALPVVLSLIDQIHGLRQALRDLGRAVEGQPKNVQEDIARAFREQRKG